MTCYPRCSAVIVEFDIQWSPMRWECQSSGYGGTITNLVVDSSILISDRKRTSSCQIAIVWYLANVPNSMTSGISKILALSVVGCTVQIAMEVHLFPRIILMDVLTITRDIVSTVLNAEDAPSFWMLCDTNRIAKTPTEKLSTITEVVGLCDVGDVEGLDLTVPRVYLFCKQIDISIASSADNE